MTRLTDAVVRAAVAAASADLLTRTVMQEEDYSAAPAIIAATVAMLTRRASTSITSATHDLMVELMDEELRAAERQRAAEDPDGESIKKLWVAERDACLHCLAYQGQVVSVDGEFPHNLTFGDKPLTPFGGILERPPLHPNCRCEILAYRFSNDVGPVHAPEALKREARRSVLKGWSLDTESNAARLRAAERLLATNPDLPKTVIEQAERAIRRGEFLSRRVPSVR